MDSDGYPEKIELRTIEKWDALKDPFGLIDYIEQRWAYKDWGFKKEWGKSDYAKIVLNLELHTAGWSGNEDLINSVLKNTWFRFYYTMWKRGGHYWFEINPYSMGWVTVNEYCKKNNVSRQYVHHNKEKFDWLETGTLKMVKQKLLKEFDKKL